MIDLKDETYLSCQVLSRVNLCFRFDLGLHAAASSLNEGCHARCPFNFYPLHLLQVQDEHLVEELPRFGLAPADYHAFIEYCGAVVLTSSSRKASCFQLTDGSAVGVELQQLIRALSSLSLGIEHEAAAEDVNFAIKSACCMTLATLHRLRARIRNSLPNDRTSVYFSGYYILACVEIETANHEHGVSN